MFTADTSLRIVRCPSTYEWFVDVNGIRLCSLEKVNGSKGSWVLRGSMGDWQIERLSSSRFLGQADNDDSRTAEIRVGVYKYGPSGEEPESYTDLYVDRCTYLQQQGGAWTSVEFKKAQVLRYIVPWRDEDRSNHVCFLLEEKVPIPVSHRDLVFVAPLFWSGKAVCLDSS